MILGIDPGPERTAYLHFRDGEPGGFGIVANAEMLRILDGYKGPVCIEMIASYGMAVGQSVFTTCRWIGRFQQAVAEPEAVHFLYRKQIVTHLCGSARAKDANVRLCCGDWSRICGPSPTVKLGITAIRNPV